MLETKDLSDRFYNAEKLLWSISLILIFSSIFGIQENPIKIIEVEFKSYQDSIRATAALLIATSIYQLIEFHLSEPKNKTKTQRIRLAPSILVSLVALATAYPIAIQNTAYEEVTPTWYLAFLGVSLLTASSLSMLTFSAFMIRSKEESNRLKIPRIPIAIKAQITLQTPLLAILITINALIIFFAPPQARPIGIAILSLVSFCFILSTITPLLKRNQAFAQGESRLDKLRAAFDSHDHSYFLADQMPETMTIHTKSPQELQKEISAKFKIDEPPKNIEFRVQTLEPFQIAFKPKTPQNDPEFDLITEPQGKHYLKVKILPALEHIPPKDLSLPVKAIARNAQEFLKNHKKGRNQDPGAALNYALKQTAITTLTENHTKEIPVDVLTTGNQELISKYISSNTDLNQRQAHGWTPLIMAIAQGDIHTEKSLLDLGADPDIKNLQGRSPLHFAARYANLESSLLLIEYGANINTQDSEGNTPLIIGTIYGRLEIVDALIKSGADIEIKNNKKETALELSQKLRHGKIAKALRMKTKQSGESAS